MAHVLQFDSYTTQLGYGGYEYRVQRGDPPPATQEPGIARVTVGTTHAIWLEDEKYHWYIGQCDTIEQALTMIGNHLVSNAALMAEAASCDA